MKFGLLLSFVASGLLFGHTAVKSEDTSTKISGRERIALETSSPRVHVSRRDMKKGRMDRVVSDKTTVNAFVPVGK